MKKEMVLKKTRVFGDYGKKRLLDCSASFQDLAKTFLNIRDPEKTEDDRYYVLLNKNRTESRTMLAEHLFEMADIMAEVAQESMSGVEIEDKIRKRIEKDLKEQNIILTNLTMLVDSQKRYKLVATMHTSKYCDMTTEDIGGILSTELDKRLVPAKGSVVLLHSEDESVIYEEETKYQIMTGIARAIKEGEALSGDNYGIQETNNGQLYIAISDGAGSGEQANRASKTVIDLLERFLEANFSVETAIQMINGVLLASEAEKNLSTLDICHIDLNTGECEFIKVGACNSYIRSEGLIEVVMSGTLPLGVFYRVEIEKTKGSLDHGNYVILFSDGIPDSLGDEDDVMEFENMLSTVTYENPQELANFILSYVIHASNGKIRDDMTVLVIGIWDNTLQFS